MAGVFALGVVWGWWAAPLFERRSHVATVLSLGAATLQAGETLWIAGPKSLVWLLPGWLIGLVLHRAARTGWRARVTS